MIVYIEIMRHGQEDEESRNQVLLSVCREASGES